MGTHSSRAAVSIGEDKLARAPLVLYAATPSSMSTVELKMWADHFKGLLDEESIIFLYEKFKNILNMSSKEEIETMRALKEQEKMRAAIQPSRSPGDTGRGGGTASGSDSEGESGDFHGGHQTSMVGSGTGPFRKQALVCAGIFPATFHRYMCSIGAFKGIDGDGGDMKVRSLFQKTKEYPSKSRGSVTTDPTSRCGASALPHPRGLANGEILGEVVDASSASEGTKPFFPPAQAVNAMPSLAHLFRAFDADRDGIISFSDFLIFHVAMGYHTEEHLASLLFYAYDADGDHWISYDDLVTVLTASTACVGDLHLTHSAVSQAIHGEAQRLMAFLDVYRTGRVSEEVLHLLGQRHPEILEKLRYLL